MLPGDWGGARETVVRAVATDAAGQVERALRRPFDGEIELVNLAEDQDPDAPGPVRARQEAVAGFEEQPAGLERGAASACRSRLHPGVHRAMARRGGGRRSSFRRAAGARTVCRSRGLVCASCVRPSSSRCSRGSCPQGHPARGRGDTREGCLSGRRSTGSGPGEPQVPPCRDSSSGPADHSCCWSSRRSRSTTLSAVSASAILRASGVKCSASSLHGRSWSWWRAGVVEVRRWPGVRASARSLCLAPGRGRGLPAGGGFRRRVRGRRCVLRRLFEAPPGRVVNRVGGWAERASRTRGRCRSADGRLTVPVAVGSYE